MTEPIKLSTFVLPELPKQRIDAQWSRIAERRPLERKRNPRLMPAAGALVVLGALGVLWWPGESSSVSESVWEGSVVASEEAPVDMTLAEGTHIKVEPRSEVKLLRSAHHSVQVRLAHGSARFDVAKKPARRFSVQLGRIEVVVTGTQFRVVRKRAATGERVQVEVLEGSVEVRRDGGDAVSLHRGERWSTIIDDEDESASERAVADTVQPQATDPEAGEAAPAEDAGDGEELDAPGEDVRTSDDGRASRRRRGDKLSAEELFDHANLARRAGRLDDAADLYAKLVAAHPSDRRAPLAAFELGRLRMDSLRDVRGAIRALERALKLAPQGTFAEDAMARLVLAQEALDDRAGCARARARYLARYPEGVHALHVAERCGEM